MMGLNELMLRVRDLPDKDSAEWKAAAEEFYESSVKFVYKQLHRLGVRGDDMEDICQDVFLRIFQYRKSFDPGKGSVLTWIGMIIANIKSDFYKRAGRISVITAFSLDDEDAPDIPCSESVSGQAVNKIAMEDVLHYLSELKASDDGKNNMAARVLAYQLNKWHGVSYRDIGRICKAPESTVNNWIHRLGADVRARFGSII
jgi:RNA polymerase sigma-70 factor (ECF subfamily)